jgi:DNA-directed RNA polymerase specialized sigma24 family protein
MTIDPRELASSTPSGLDARQWRALLPQVTTYARRRLRGGCPERARELAQEAAARAWEKGRGDDGTCDVETMRQVLKGLVNGLAVNERRRWRHAREVAVSDEQFASFASGSTPEEAYLRREERAVTLASLRQKLGRDAVGVRIVDLLQDGIEDAAAQAAALVLPIAVIQNGRKRLRRHLRRMAKDAGRKHS